MSRADGYIPEPTIILLGCRAWDNKPFGVCPVCNGGVRAGDDGIHCAKCSSSSPAIERRCATAKVVHSAKERAADGSKELRDELDKRHRNSAKLTELERRQIANGYTRKGLNSKNSGVVNRARVGREWLQSINQMPDYDLILDKRGNVTGRYSEQQQADA